jgi:hydrogenase expression/formation protein HypD
MKYVDDFRDPDLARALAAEIADEVCANREYRLMEFCGGHTHAIFRYGVRICCRHKVRMIHGPGCPVCVLPDGPAGHGDPAGQGGGRDALHLWRHAARSGLAQAIAPEGPRRGADIRMVASTMDALQLARATPEKDVVFFAIGFETTTPPTAVALKQAKARG